MKDESDPRSSRFWTAICENDLHAARSLLEEDASLAARDYRPETERNPHADGFPLHRACAAGNWDMAALLLEFGVDVDCRSPTEAQRELGMPLWWAVDRRNYQFAHQLLDQGADVGAYAWANATMADRLCEYALEDGAPHELMRGGFTSYLGETGPLPVASDAPESVKLLQRVLSLGAQLTFGLVVEAQYYELVAEFLQTCPEQAGTPHDDPPGTVLENLCDAASWSGRPQVMTLAMDHCRHLFRSSIATRAIQRAIVSHNRFGSADDYYTLMETQLTYLREAGSLEALIEEATFLPHHLGAGHYLWPNHYGYGPGPSSVASMIALTDLLRSFGFDPQVTNADGLTPQAVAEERRLEGHAGMQEYIDYLQSLAS